MTRDRAAFKGHKEEVGCCIISQVSISLAEVVMDPGRLVSESRDEGAQGALAGGTEGPVGCGRTLSLRVPWGTGQGHPSGPAVPHSPASPGAPGRSQGQRPFSWSQQTAPREGADISWTHTRSCLQHPALPANPRVTLPRPRPPQEPTTFLALFPRTGSPLEPPTPSTRHQAPSAGSALKPCPSTRTVDAANAAAIGAIAAARKWPSRWRRLGLRAQGCDEDRPPRGHSLTSSHLASQPYPLWKPVQLRA